MSDIEQRLEWDKRYTNGHVPVTMDDAIKEITRLKAALTTATKERDEARETLNEMEGEDVYCLILKCQNYRSTISEADDKIADLTRECEELKTIISKACEDMDGYDGQNPCTMMHDARKKLSEQAAEVERLRERDGNATIILCRSMVDDPFRQDRAKVIDFGVSDNVYMVDGQLLIDEAARTTAARCAEIAERLPIGSGLQGKTIAAAIRKEFSQKEESK